MDEKDPKRCSATSRKGVQCARTPIPGGRVCHYHGGAAPQVKKAAAMRLAALVDPAIGVLAKLLKSKHPSVQLGAVKDVLDRNGFKPTDKTQLTGAEGGPIKTEMKLVVVGAGKPA